MPPQPDFILGPTLTHPDAEAVWTPTRSFTWHQLEERARRFAQALRAAGLRPDEAWAILAPNRGEWAEVTLGNARAGTRYVPLNWHLAEGELIDMLTDSGARLLLVDPDYDEIGHVAAAAAGIDTVITLGSEYERWLAAASAAPLDDGPLGVPLQYTGGTTGPSRGVIRPESQGRRASEFAAVSNRWATLTGMPDDGRTLLATPAYHTLGGAVLRSAMARGVPLSILPKWDEVAVLRTIAEQQITTTAMVPTQFIRLLKLDPVVRESFDVSAIRWILHTAAPCPAWTKEAMIEWMGPVIVELYGSSEGAGPFICTSEEWLARPGTVGRPVGGLVVSIVGDDDEDLPSGEVGRVFVARPDGAPEYHGAPEKSAEMCLPDGRFTVGDLGWVDDDGYLFLADRRVDLIISGGTNIYPSEIEGVLSCCEGIADVAVFGVPHPEWGQEVMAVIELTVGSTIGHDEVLDHARLHLASFKVPRRVEFVDALPREASGKLKKRLLRDQYLDAAATAEVR